MSRVINLVSDLERLVDRYSIEEVETALNFIKSFNKLESVKHIKVWSNAGATTELTIEQYRELARLWKSDAKISAIKRLREISFMGLKDAKDIVEQTDWNRNL